jgi:hypothetical protein
VEPRLLIPVRPTTAWTVVEDGTAIVPPRFNAAAAVDVGGRRVLIHGGLENNVVSQVTSLWTGTWQRFVNTTPDSSPGRVSFAAIAFDSMRREFVHFGGLNETTGVETNDTWVYATAWSKKSPAAPLPGARFGHVLVHDAARERTVLFGGYGFDDTWLWDGSAWQPTTPATKPSPRGSPAAAYGATWTPRNVAGPPARSEAGMAWDAARKRIVLFGGAGQSSAFNDQWEWDGQAWKQIPTFNTVKPRASYVMVSALGEGGVLVFGGIGDGAAQLSDLLWLHWDNEAARELCHATDGDGDALAGCADADCWRVCTPDCEPGGMTRLCGPASVGTSIVAPSAAWL